MLTTEEEGKGDVGGGGEVASSTRCLALLSSFIAGFFGGPHGCGSFSVSCALSPPLPSKESWP